MKPFHRISFYYLRNMIFKNLTGRYRIIICALSVIFLFTVNAAAKVVSEETAQDVANSFLASKGLTRKNLTLSRSSDNSSALKASTIDPPAYHIFRGAERNDFIIVSGDDVARPILGYFVDNNNCADDSIPPAMKEWLDAMERQILYARENGAEQSPMVAIQWKAPGIGDVVQHLNTAKWHQDNPYNLQCPLQNGNRCATGCTATALAIVMKYHGYPSKGRGFIPAYTCPISGVNVNSRNLNHSYDWDSMPLEFVSGQYSNQQANNVAELMADIGAAIQSDYSINSTKAPFENDQSVFIYFGYNSSYFSKKNYSVDDWYSMMRNELDNERPIPYCATTKDGQGGHAFVIDGYTDQNYFSVNWGWGGTNNGYFALDALVLNEHTFSDDQAALFNFQPANTLPTTAMLNDSIECPSLNAAASFVPSNGQESHIRLVQNCSISSLFIYYNQNIVLDLNGFDIEIDDYGFYNYGTLTITNSKGYGKITVRQGNTQMIANYGVLIVNGGEFVNNISFTGTDYDFRRCIWNAENATTIIRDGKFSCKGQVIYSIGKLTIDNGEFKTTGNNSVLTFSGSADTLTINGGTFSNLSTERASTDYRRAILTAQGTVTHITNGKFSSASQVLAFNGNAVIENATIENTGNGYGCISFGNVVINDCKLKATTILYADRGSSLKCYGGVYSKKVSSTFLGTGCQCKSNSDTETAAEYPFKVVKNSDEISPVFETGTDDIFYDLNGMILQDDKSRIQVIRKADGNNIKVFKNK